MMRRNARMKRDVFLADIGTRPLIMGILNVTPDSFFDGGRYIAGGATLARVRQMVVDGCDIVDIGAASTRPEAIRDYRRRRNPACTRRRGACRRAAGPSGDARHVACSSAKRRKPNSFHLRQSVSCFSSMVKIAPSLTSISRTMHMRPVLSMSLTS